MMKKCILLTLILIFVLMGMTILHAEDKQAKLIIDGRIQSTPIQVMSGGNVMLVSIEEIVKYWGGTMHADPQNAVYTITIGDKVIILRDKSNSATVNSTQIMLGASPVYTGKKLMVPLSFFYKVLNMSAEWDDKNSTIEVISYPELEIIFKDKNLEAAIRKSINNPIGVIKRKDLKTVKALSVNSMGVAELEGLQHAFNLTNLYLYDNQISSLEPLRGLVNLNKLSLSGNRINDIKPLVGLTSLKELGLSDNPISDISPLVNMKKLIVLDLRRCNLKDIGALSNCSSLAILWLDENEITDIYPLKGLKTLSQLFLSDNSVEDISFIRELANLTRLEMDNNKIKDISALSGLTKLRLLVLSFNEIEDISSLSNVPALESVNLTGNKLTDINPISGLTKLYGLSIYKNRVRDISPLSGLTNLTGLNISDNLISSIEPLKSLVKLDSLFMGQNSIEDISILSDHTNLTYLDISDNRIRDISILNKHTKLAHLKAGNNQIQHADFLRNLPALEYLTVGVNPLADISGLTDENDGKVFKELDIYGLQNVEKQKAVYQKAKDIINSIIRENMSEYAKVRTIHDYIAENTRYDHEAAEQNSIDDAHYAYGMLIEGEAVCSGYADATKILMNMAGIECMIVLGDVYKDDFISHAWNIVKVDGQYYQMDITWDDKEDGFYYKYFLIDDEDMSNKRHTWNMEKYPKCESTKYIEQ